MVNLKLKRDRLDLMSFFDTSEKYQDLHMGIEKQINLTKKFYHLISESTPDVLDIMNTSRSMQQQ